MKGRCLICGRVDRLTRDHVPPKGAVRPTRLDVHDIADYLSSQPRKSRRAYGSLDFPSLCHECNVDRLGGEYDPALKEFSNRVAAWIRARYALHLSLPASFSVATKPHRLLRAVIGHLLAAEYRPDPTTPLVQAPMPKAMRGYFLDPKLPLPDELTVYCWPYPSPHQVILRATGVARFRDRASFAMGDFIKFYPLAYWVAWRPPLGRIPLSTIRPDPHCELDTEREVEVALRKVPPVDWPETPQPDEYVLVNSGFTFIASPSQMRKG